MTNPKFSHAIELIDQANSDDPNLEVFQGQEYPKELLYSLRMTEVLQRFTPNASEALQLAARAQHICRWQSPRSDFPMNREGYLTWRKNLYQFHANKAGELLTSIHYPTDVIEQVQFLLLKKQIKANAQSQTLEDVVCLVFLQYYFSAFAKGHKQEKVMSIVQKTWRKMSEQGHQAALVLPYSEQDKALILNALS